MARSIGPKRLLHLLAQQVNLDDLCLEEQVEVFRTMARIMGSPPACVPKRERPRCGARCRDGHGCQAKVVWDEDCDAPVNGRCRLHGGLSTGPRTPEGRQRIGDAARQRAQARRQATAQAAAQTSALATYRQAVAVYEELHQHPMPGFPGFQVACMQVQGREVEQRYHACLACGVDPRR